MMKKLMFFAAMVVALFASCSSDDEPISGGNGTAKTVSLSINADLAAASRVGFAPDGGGLKTSFQEGDYLMVYFRAANGGWLKNPAYTVLYFDPASANGSKGTFRASNVVIPSNTGLLHILIGSTKGGTPYIDAADGKCALVDNLSEQEGTLESAAIHSVFEADPRTEGNLTYNKDNTQATLNNVTFKPNTSVVKIDATFPEGVKVEKGTPLTVTTESTYNQVQISAGKPGGSSLPAKAEGEAKFNIKVAEVNGNVATAYMTIWPGVKDDEFSGVSVTATIDGKNYTGDYTKTKEGKLEAGKLYKMATTMALTSAETQKIWVNDSEQDVVAAKGTGDTETDWLTVAGGKIHAKANETGAPRTGTITVDGVPYEITQVEAKDFKGNWDFYSKKFNSSKSVGGPSNTSVTAVTIGEPLKAETLADANGKEYTNNIGVKGLYFNTVMSGCVDIDYTARTVRIGMFLDSREAQATGNSTYQYAAYIPEGSSGLGWGGYTFAPLDYSTTNYDWLWFNVSTDMNKISYIYYQKGQKMGKYYVCGLSIPVGTSTDRSSLNVGADQKTYDCIYQANYNGKNDEGMYFVRK